MLLRKQKKMEHWESKYVGKQNQNLKQNQNPKQNKNVAPVTAEDVFHAL